MAKRSTSAAKLKTGIGGKLVSAKSKTGDPACSKAMSDWKTSGMTPIIAAILGKCRAAAKGLKQAAQHALAGNTDKAAAARPKPPTEREKAAEWKARLAAEDARIKKSQQNAGRKKERAARAPKIREKLAAFIAKKTAFRLSGKAEKPAWKTAEFFDTKTISQKGRIPLFPDLDLPRGSLRGQRSLFDRG